MALNMRKGWYGESHRHSLARKGVKTSSLKKGARIEGKEHPSFTGKQAERIASDHLRENPDYYNNPAELVGQQVRIRVVKPKRNARYRTVDVGEKGKLQLVLQDGKTQSLRFNLDDYRNEEELVMDLQSDSVRRVTTSKARAEAYVIASDYYKKRGGMR